MLSNRMSTCVIKTRIHHYFKVVHTPGTRYNSQMEIARDTTPRRALMYCPGDDLRKINKGIQSNADCIALDCEDGVAINRKKEARETIQGIFNGEKLPVRPEVGVRVNSVDSGLCAEDLQVILAAAHLPTTLYLPKVESNEHLLWFGEMLVNYLTKDSTVNLVMFAETARAIMDLPEICKAAFTLSRTHKFLPVGIVFGSDDLYASIGASRSIDGAELLYARQRLVLIAKAFGLQAIDMVHIQYKDLESLKEQSEAGARLGYTGKQVIHPGQIDTVQQAFMPSPERVQWARELVQGFKLSQQQGKGAFVFKGTMIDMPLLRQAENIIQIAEIEDR